MVYFSSLNRQDIVTLLLFGISAWITRLYYARKRARSLEGKLPPGPKPLPIIGNALDMPRQDDYLTLNRWAQLYGDIVHVSLWGGQNIIYLNSESAAVDLLEKRSNIYSDRPHIPLIGNKDCVDWNFGFHSYGDLWRRHRKALANKFRSQKDFSYGDIQENLTKLLLRRLLKYPDDFLDQVELHASKLIIKALYGFDVESKDNEHVRNLLASIKITGQATRPIAFLLESIPIVRNCISLWPGVLSQRSIEQMRLIMRVTVNGPFEAAQSQMMQAGNEACFVSDMLEQGGANADKEVIKNSAATAYVAGVDSTVASTLAFILAMVNYPEVQRKAQAEIDRVVGTDRLPTFQDRESLPYVMAICKETLRWHTVVPEAVPHQLREDDTYSGYFLPAGSTVVVNAWGILHDPITYPDPMEFKPERYFSEDGELDLSEKDPARVAFGFGRRLCAGMYFAESSLWIFIARMLATVDMSHKIDEQGREIEAILQPSSGLASHPAPFQCLIVPRSEQTKKLILME